jgi:hypothetical protein
MLGGVWACLVAEGLTRLVCRVFGLVKFEVNAEAAESAEIAEKDFQSASRGCYSGPPLGMAPAPAGSTAGRRSNQIFSAISAISARSALTFCGVRSAAGDGATCSRLIQSGRPPPRGSFLHSTPQQHPEHRKRQHDVRADHPGEHS